MAGALMQLVAYGAQDVYLTADPTITYWKAVYKRYTNFAMESMIQSLSGTPNFGNKVVCKISRNGDLISRTYVQVTLPDISSYNSYYVNRVGFCLLKTVELRIGGQQIDIHYNKWMHVWTELTHNVDMKSLLDKLVGPKELDGDKSTTNNPGTLNIPLLFSYCRNPGLALPLIALQYHEVELWITFETLNKCLTDLNKYATVPSTLTLSNVNVWIDYIFLDTEERKEFAQKPHEYLIEITQNQESSISSTTRSTTRLTFNHPTKFITWVAHDPTNDGCNTWSQISAGNDHVIALSGDGTVWVWGDNTNGQLGLGNNTITPIQTKLNITNVAAVASGNNISFILKKDGTLWGSGSNGDGQLGIGTNTDTNVFTQVIGDNYKKISTSGSHTMAIKRDGTLWAWGWNGSGQLGLGNNTDYNTPQQVGTDTDWADVITSWDGDGFTMALKTDGSLYSTGYNGDGELGINSLIDQTTFQLVGTGYSQVSCGSYHTIAIKTDGSLYSWGYNGNGQLGLDDTTDRDIPTQVGTDTDWSLVGCGDLFSMALKINNTLYGWGANSNGQLGLGDTTNRDIPTLISGTWNYFNAGGEFSMAINNFNELYSTGNNEFGQLGFGYATTNNNYVTIPLIFSTSANNNWKQLFVNNVNDTDSTGHNFGIKNDGSLWAWGSNLYGKLGIGLTSVQKSFTNTPTLVNNGPWKSVAIGYDHTLGLKEDGTLWAWGRNNIGQLGQGAADVNQHPLPLLVTGPWSATGYVKSIGANHFASFVINNNDEIFGWGENARGELGIGNTTSPILTPTQEDSASTNWKGIYAGAYHMIAVKTDNSLWSWGVNDNGELGNNTTNAGGGDQSQDKDFPVQVSGSITDASIIAVGAYHTLIVRANGSLWGWGYNGFGQLSLPTSGSKIIVPTLISSDSWKNVNGGAYCSGAVKSDNSLWTTGKNSSGQLGLGDTTNRSSLTQVGYSHIWTNVLAAGGMMYGFMSNDEIWTWGNNQNGQLGITINNFINFTEVPCSGDDSFTSFSSYNVSVNTISSAKIRLNGQDRFQERDGLYFNYIVPYQHFEIKPDTGINVYSFALKPAEHQPSGSCNLSRIDNVNLDITPTINPEGDGTPLQLSVYAFSYNVLRIASGMGGLAFSN